MADFPGSVKTFATLVDLVDDALAIHQNERGDEITAIETYLLDEFEPVKLSVETGWIELSESWSYASASTITVPTDATTRFKKGWRIRLKQGGGYKYYVITGVAATLLTVDVNTDYTVANAAITDIAISKIESPLDFPAYFNYSPSWTNLTVGTGTQIARKTLTVSRLCYFNINVTFGATTSISGAVSVAPSPDASGYSSTNAYMSIGNVSMIDAGVALYMGASVLRHTGGIEVRAINASGTYATWSAISSTVPWTWGDLDLLNIDGLYRY